jgi:hypothetical protein
MAGKNNKASRGAGGSVGPSTAAQRFQQASQAAKGRTERAVARTEAVLALPFSKGIERRKNRQALTNLNANGYLIGDPAAAKQAAKGRSTMAWRERSPYRRGYRAPQTRLY